MRLEIDCARLIHQGEAFDHLEALFRGMEGHGRNLDALYDALTALPEAELTIIRAQQAEGYAMKVLRVLRDAARENPGLKMIEKAADPVRIGVGLYIVREDAANDLGATLGRLKAIGYDGAELLGFFGAAPAALKSMLEAFKLEALGDHVPLDAFLKDPNRVLEDHLAIGCRRITLYCPRERVEAEPFGALAGGFSEAAARCLRAGVTPMYHNHDFDMRGEEPFALRMLDAVKNLRFEPDVGWMAVAGKDPARCIAPYKDRTPVIHLKDVHLMDGGFVFRPTGYGDVNTPKLLPALLACNPEWLMVDHDLAYARDSYNGLALSFQYVKTLLSLEP